MEIQSEFRVQKASLHPPALYPDDDDDGSGGGGAENEIPWVLLDQIAYVSERVNATTAVTETWDGKKIQVTLCLARPPRVSYLCVYCPGLPHTVFPMEPKILAVEEDLLLLRIIVSTRRDFRKDSDYYIYRAGAAMDGEAPPPSLRRLPRPPTHYRFDAHQVGILRCGSGSTTSHHHGFIIAALCRAPDEDDPAEFVLCLYNSNLLGTSAFWSTHSISLEQQHRRHYGCNFFHINSKVISIGGDAGTMGFVDLWRGILICDVLRVEQGKPAPPLGYVTLPPPLMLDRTGDARLARDIAVLQQGRGTRTIKYVELQPHWKPCPTFRGRYVEDGWMSKTWTTTCPVASENCRWDAGHNRESSDIPVASNPHFEVLPKLLDYGASMPLKPFKGFDICQPTLSLNDDDDGTTVYFMIKKDRMDDQAWVIAVDMDNNTLQGVVPFNAERSTIVDFTYMHSRISAYLTTAPAPAPGTKGNLKRPGTVLLGSSSKKPHAFLMSLPPWDEQKQHDSEMEVDGDDMVMDI